MSHYVILVTDVDRIPLDEQMEPFSENREVIPYIDETKDELVKEALEHRDWLLGSTTSLKGDDEKELIKSKTEEEAYQIYVKIRDLRLDRAGNSLTTYNPDSKWDWYSVGGRWDGFLKTKAGEEVNMARKKELFLDKQDIPYGYLDRGQWVERGGMGWFGIASDEKNLDDWKKQFNDWFDSLSDDTLLTVVDCHI